MDIDYRHYKEYKGFKRYIKLEVLRILMSSYSYQFESNSQNEVVIDFNAHKFYDILRMGCFTEETIVNNDINSTYYPDNPYTKINVPRSYIIDNIQCARARKNRATVDDAYLVYKAITNNTDKVIL